MTTRQSHAVLTWMSEASCVDRLELPWLRDRHDVRDDDRETMMRICKVCPVLASCARHARAINASGGFWAGVHRGTRETVRLRWRA